MRIGVCGFGHLAHVTAVGVASGGHDVVQYDTSPRLLRLYHDIMTEPGWAELRRAHDRRIVETDQATDLASCELVWVAYDTPLDATGRGRDDLVVSRVSDMAVALRAGVPVILSSQWRVGTTQRLEARSPQVDFVYVPENLRAGRAVQGFLAQDRIVVGTRRDTHRALLQDLLTPFTHRLLWMSIESAEMAKHAINAHVALSIAFINEIAQLCAVVGADPGDVAEALKSDRRFGPYAPLTPGPPFGGGSLMRDLVALGELGDAIRVLTPILSSISQSNTLHATGELVQP